GRHSRAGKGDCLNVACGKVDKLPIGEGSVELAGYGKVGALIGVLRRERLIDFDSEARRVAGVHIAGLEAIVVWEDLVGDRAMVHVLLDAEVVDRPAEG